MIFLTYHSFDFLPAFWCLLPCTTSYLWKASPQGLIQGALKAGSFLTQLCSLCQSVVYDYPFPGCKWFCHLFRLGIPVISFLSHFLVNSRSKQLCVIEDFLFLRPSFSRSYRSILSSSLSRVYSITLVDLLLDHHCRFRVRFIFLCFFLSPSELKMRFNSQINKVYSDSIAIHSLLINTLSIIRKTQNLFLCSHPIKLSLYQLEIVLTYADCPSVQTLGLSVTKVFTSFFVTHVSILTNQKTILFSNNT